MVDPLSIIALVLAGFGLGIAACALLFAVSWRCEMKRSGDDRMALAAFDEDFEARHWRPCKMAGLESFATSDLWEYGYADSWARLNNPRLRVVRIGKTEVLDG